METTPVPKPTKNAAKKRPVPTKKSPVIAAEKPTAHPDDVKITALDLAPGKLSPEMAAYHRVRPATRAGVALVYIGLAIALAVGMGATHLHRTL